MNVNEVKFDSNGYLLDVSLPSIDYPVNVCIVDDLISFGGVLSNDYKGKIVDFINEASKWMVVVQGVFDKCGYSFLDARLITIYVLFEDGAAGSFFGLEFSIKEDAEHGFGLRIRGEGFDVFDYGLAEISYEIV